MSSKLQQYKIQKYLNKLQNVSPNHKSYQTYLSKYQYWLKGGLEVSELVPNHDYIYTTNGQISGKRDWKYKYCKQDEVLDEDNETITYYKFKDNTEKIVECNTPDIMPIAFLKETVKKMTDPNPPI